MTKKASFLDANLIRALWPWLFYVLMLIFFSIASKQMNDVTFISARSVQGILIFTTQILLVAIGQTFVIITAGIDLSVGFTLGLAAVVAALVMKALGAAEVAPVAVVSLGALAGVGAALIPGFINGALIARIDVPPFISTLGMGGIVTGVALLLSGGYPVAEQPRYLGQLGNGYLLYFWPENGVTFFRAPEAAIEAGALRDVVPIIPNVVVVAAVVLAVCAFVLRKTQFGQHVYAQGGNFEAAVRAGIPVGRITVFVYVIAAGLAGIAGVLWAWRFTSGAANAGESTLLNSIAAVVIGGTSLFGGEGTIVGTLVGALIIATIQFGLVILGVEPFWQFIAVGSVVILAVIVDQIGRSVGKN